MKKFRYLAERYGPSTLALVLAALVYYFRVPLSDGAQEEKIDFSGLYSSVFDWSSIQTGFLFGIYGYVAGKSDGFIAAVKNTPAMILFIGYTKVATYLGFFVTFFSIPLIVVDFSITPAAWWRYVIFIGWSFFSIWAFFAFLRVAYVFGHLIRPADQNRITG
ncbi:hypothetical protein [Mesorhizobium sp. B2-7-2]|uniref:hypothetical protein n=1 Tax=Mesorhizobium sp. B2-7-2 TaxID=2589908 RepID=UPI001127F92D|nr:hypothetical protein [Mesorhizobium sp. B2-7-2]TPJ21655.1 hypothetical protein FJ425_24720 [Mesorhizobium sp. B2-7-2]